MTNQHQGDYYEEKRGGSAVLDRPRVDKPPMYKVLMLNDHYTPMDFVVDMLVGIFNKTPEEATQIMLNIHFQGQGICGVYPKEIAQIKSTQVVKQARKNDHPLQCITEME